MRTLLSERFAPITSSIGFLEWSSLNLLAVDARDQHHTQKIAAYLATTETDSKLMFETGRSA